MLVHGASGRVACRGSTRPGARARPVSKRQHTLAYASIRQHTSAYVSIRNLEVELARNTARLARIADGLKRVLAILVEEQRVDAAAAYVSIRQHT